VPGDHCRGHCDVPRPGRAYFRAAGRAYFGESEPGTPRARIVRDQVRRGFCDLTRRD